MRGKILGWLVQATPWGLAAVLALLVAAPIPTGAFADDPSAPNQGSRPAKVGDKLTTHHFNTGTRGFAAPEDANTAVCVLQGTELAFAREVGCRRRLESEYS